MALDAEKRIPDTTLPANSFKDGDILYGSDMNRVVDTLKTAVNENYKDLKGAVKGGDAIYIEPIDGVVDAEGQPISTVDGLIKWLYDNKILNEGKIYSLRINDSKQFEYYDGESWKLATVGQQGEPGEGVPTGGLSGQFLRKSSNVSYDTEWVDAYDKPQVDSKLNNLNNATRINLLKPTLETQTKNGVTCTNNGDGTYTLNGISQNAFDFPLCNFELPKGTYKFVGSLQNDGGYFTYVINHTLSETYIGDVGNGYVFTINQTCNLTFLLWGNHNITFNNLVFKPMITTNLNATYDDFVSYEDSLATNRVMSTRVNLLKPTLQTQTQNGVEIVNNGDGTYTFNGTSTGTSYLTFGKVHLNKGIYRLLGSFTNEAIKDCKLYIRIGSNAIYDSGNGINFEVTSEGDYIVQYQMLTNKVFDNIVIKPMITPNLNATYDDFIACLGTSWTQDTANGYYTKTIACSGITSKDNPTIDVVSSGTLEEMQAQQDEWSKILKIETSTDTLKFYASEPTTVSLSVMVKGV